MMPFIQLSAPPVAPDKYNKKNKQRMLTVSLFEQDIEALFYLQGIFNLHITDLLFHYYHHRGHFWSYFLFAAHLRPFYRNHTT